MSLLFVSLLSRSWRRTKERVLFRVEIQRNVLDCAQEVAEVAQMKHTHHDLSTRKKRVRSCGPTKMELLFRTKKNLLFVFNVDGENLREEIEVGVDFRKRREAAEVHVFRKWM